MCFDAPSTPTRRAKGMDASADYTDDWRDMFVIGSTDRTNAA
mgnify:FL=1